LFVKNQELLIKTHCHNVGLCVLLVVFRKVVQGEDLTYIMKEIWKDKTIEVGLLRK